MGDMMPHVLSPAEVALARDLAHAIELVIAKHGCDNREMAFMLLGMAVDTLRDNGSSHGDIMREVQEALSHLDSLTPDDRDRLVTQCFKNGRAN